MSFVFQRKGIWYSGYRNEAGKQKKAKSPVQTKAGAKQWAAELELKAKRVAEGVDDAVIEPHTWDEACDRYVMDAMPNLRSTGSAKSVMKNHVTPGFKGKYLRQITQGEAEAWLTRLRSKLKDGSRENLRGRAFVVYAFAERLGWAKKGSNPFGHWRVRVAEKRPTFLTEDEVRALLRCESPLRNQIAVTVYCGLRKGESCGLRWADVDLVKSTILVQHSFDGPTKSGKPRAVTIPSECLGFLLEQRRKAKGDYVFPAPNGLMRPRAWNSAAALKSVLKKAGVKRSDIVWHSLRSTFGTHFAAQTGDIASTQDALGHADPKLTKAKYAGAIPEHRIRQSERFGFGLTPAELPALRGREQRLPSPTEEAP